MRTIEEIKSKLLEHHADPDRVLWVCYRFHPDSEVQAETPGNKGQKASDLAGYNFDLNDPSIQEISTDFFVYLDEVTWELYLSTEAHISELLKELRSPISGIKDDNKIRAMEIRSKYPQHIRDLNQQQRELLKEITSGETEAERFVRQAREKEKSLGPESRAKVEE